MLPLGCRGPCWTVRRSRERFVPVAKSPTSTAPSAPAAQPPSKRPSHPSLERKTGPGTGAAPTRMQANRSVASLAGPVFRALSAIDGRLVRQLVSAVSPVQRQQALVESALLLQLRRGLTLYAEDAGSTEGGARIDTAVAEGLLEGIEAILATLADLDASPQRRALRHVLFCRELAGQLRVLGGEASAEKTAAEALKVRLTADAAVSAALVAEIHKLWRQLSSKLDAHSPLKAPSLFEEWLRPQG